MVNSKKKSYYTIVSLVLTACVAFGTYAWIATSNNGDKGNQKGKGAGDIGVVATPDLSFIDEVGNNLNSALESEEDCTPAPSEMPKKGKKDKGDETKETSVEVIYPEFVAPVNGSICLEYSMEAPVFSETLQEWRTHSGIDIAADLGDSVKCAADGVVQYVKNDPRYGTTVIVDHSSGVNTIYSNLAENVLVTSGQEVTAGDVLGYVGSTSYFESLDTAHLHLEVTANNENVDPTNMFPLEK